MSGDESKFSYLIPEKLTHAPICCCCNYPAVGHRGM